MSGFSRVVQVAVQKAFRKEADDDEAVEQQAELLTKEGTMWHLVANSQESSLDADREEFEAWFPKNLLTSNLNKKYSPKFLQDHEKHVKEFEESVELKDTGVFFPGPVGDTILHLCYLLKKYELGRYLIEGFGRKLLNHPYKKRNGDGTGLPGLYDGEVVLHIAIAHRNVEEVKYLLSKGAEVNVRATGKFFQPGTGSCYYGEYPLSFAVCVESKDIVDILVRNQNSAKKKKKFVNAQDTHGNTALHLAVIHDLPDMYCHLVKEHKAEQHIANNQGLTPLSLAAHNNNASMFETITMMQRTVAWAFGPVTAYKMPLRDIDTVIDDQDKIKSIPALKVAVEMGNADILEMPMILQWMQEKWALLHWYFYLEVGLYLLLMVCVSILVAFQRPGKDGGRTFHQVFLRAKAGRWFEALQSEALTEEERLKVLEGNPVQSINYDGHVEIGTDEPAVVAFEIICLILVVIFCVLFWYDCWKFLEEFLKFKKQVAKVKKATVPKRRHHSSFREDTMALIRSYNEEDDRAPQSREGWPDNDDPEHLVTRKMENSLWDYCMHMYGQSNLLSIFLFTFIVSMLLHFAFWCVRLQHPSWQPAIPNYTPNGELAIAVICGWTYVLYFASGFRFTGPLVVMVFKMVAQDLTRFMLIYLSLLIGFAQAFYLVAQNEEVSELTGELNCNYCSVADSILSLFRSSLGDFNYESLKHPTASNFLTFLFVMWTLVSNILMMNLLIALMNSTYEAVTGASEQIWLRSWARLVLLHERRWPQKKRNHLGKEDKKPGEEGQESEYIDVLIEDSSKAPSSKLAPGASKDTRLLEQIWQTLKKQTGDDDGKNQAIRDKEEEEKEKAASKGMIMQNTSSLTRRHKTVLRRPRKNQNGESRQRASIT